MGVKITSMHCRGATMNMSAQMKMAGAKIARIPTGTNMGRSADEDELMVNETTS